MDSIKKPAIKIFLFLIINFLYIQANDNDILMLDTIVVTATKSPVKFYQLSRNVSVITKKEMEEKGSQNIYEIIDEGGFIDLQTRQNNVQSNVTMRGSNYEQTLIMINGVVMNNPHTGIFNFNLPIINDEIDCVEIMPGHSSSLYGSYGFGGTINFITDSELSKKIIIGAKYSSFNTLGVTGSINYNYGKLGVSVNSMKETSDGYRYDTEYNLIKFNTLLRYHLGENEKLEFFFGRLMNKYGAYDFYTPGKNIPSRETVENNIVYSKYQKEKNKFNIKTVFYYHQSSEDYIYDKNNPALYHAIHDMDRYGTDFIFEYNHSKDIIFTSFFNHNFEKISSNKFGIHKRKRFSIGAEMLYNKKIAGLSITIRDEYYINNNIVLPSIGVYKWLNNKIKTRASYGLSYRIPSFTELYVNDPSNKGRKNLKSGKNNSYEIGLDIYHKSLISKNTLFYRKESDFIDWIGSMDSLNKIIWSASNINQIQFIGLENEIVLPVFNKYKLLIRNSIIRATSSKDYISKYGLNYTRNQTNFSLNIPLKYHIDLNLNIMYKIRKDDRYLLTAIYLQKELVKDFILYFKSSNVFDIKYEEIKGIPQPGRILTAGMKYQL
jgi:vitamin B12 transporter